MGKTVRKKIMEKQKLIQIILKDTAELNEIACELGSSNDLSKFELEIALSKSKLIYQEFELLNELSSREHSGKFDNSAFDRPWVPFLPESEETTGIPEPVPAIQEPGQHHAEDNGFKEPEGEPEKDSPEQKPQKIAVEQGLPEKPPKEPFEKPEEEEVKIPDIAPDEEIENNRKTVGEHFIKGKSLNDLLTENKTQELKLPGSHIEKLEYAIGLNDRFQYTRELFDNNPELFKNTIRQIDQLSSLDEAVSYLNSHFKWKKTDTSIQFAKLVKRRFPD